MYLCVCNTQIHNSILLPCGTFLAGRVLEPFFCHSVSDGDDGGLQVVDRLHPLFDVVTMDSVLSLLVCLLPSSCLAISTAEVGSTLVE